MGIIAIQGLGKSSTAAEAPPLDFFNDDYQRPLLQLLPNGVMWPKEDGTEIAELMRALSYHFARIERRGGDLVHEADPSRIDELLPEWESVMDLDAGTLDDESRRGAIIALLRGHVSPSTTNIMAIATGLGYSDARFHYYDAFVAGSGAGYPCYSWEWNFRWDIVRLSRGTATDTALEGVLAAITPSHTVGGFIDPYDTWNDPTSGPLFAAGNPGGVAFGESIAWVLVGTGASIWSTEDLETWTSRTAGGGYVGDFTDIAFGAALFVAVGSAAGIQSSPDGVTWTARTAGGGYAGDFKDVVYANGLFVAVGSAGGIQTSTDGTTWTARTPGSAFAGTFYGVAWSDDFDLWFAVGTGGVIQTSPDGVTWTQQTSGAADLLSVACGDGIILIARGAGGAVLRSNNGTVWTAISTYAATNPNLIEFFDGYFILGSLSGGNPAIELSADQGDSWVVRNLSGLIIGGTVWGVGFGSNTEDTLVVVSDGSVIAVSALREHVT